MQRRLSLSKATLPAAANDAQAPRSKLSPAMIRLDQPRPPAAARPLWAQFCATLVAVLLMVAGAAKRQLPRLRHTPTAAPLDPDCARSDESQSSLAQAWMSADWRWVWTEGGTWLMVLCVTEAAFHMGVHSFERARHLHIAVGMSTGLAAALIVALVAVQAVACGCLLVPAAYHRVGSIAPSAALVTALWFEAVMFGDTSDTPTLTRVVSLTLTCAMLALFRFDRKIRNAQQQLPTSGALLAVESHVRRLCSGLRTGITLPPLALVAVGWAVGCNPYWRRHGIEYEWLRSRFHAAVAFAAFMLLTSGQDTKAHAVIGEWLERVHDVFMRHKEDVLGQPRHTRFLGAKKAL